MRKKMLISAALLVVMLLNCILPVFAEGQAVLGNGEIRFNPELYHALVDSLEKDGYQIVKDDIKLTIKLTDELISKVTRLNLNEHRISDLTGIENFKNLQHLELSGNNLSKDSNLEALSNLTSLNYLDLSTNKIEDVSSIDPLIEKIQKEKGTIILSGQTVRMVHKISVDESEGADNELVAYVELPAILEKAGYIKKNWINTTTINETTGTIGNGPTLKKFVQRVTKDNRLIEVNIANENTGLGYNGLLKIEIYIHDDDTEAGSASNLNPASKNMLNGSRFYIYVVVCGSSSEGISIPDTNLYNAIKEQLTANQTVNKDLDSYKYSVNAIGEPIVEEFILTGDTTDDPTKIILVNKRELVLRGEALIYVYDTKTNEIYRTNQTLDGDTVDGPSYVEYADNVQNAQIVLVNPENGININISGYKASKLNLNSEDLYIAAYDEAKILVIRDVVLVNKITSLKLNNKEIYDLEGIQYFVGLEDYLNVSHNYLDNIDPIYDLTTNKDSYEAQIQELFLSWLNSREWGNLAQKDAEFKANYNTITNGGKGIVAKTEEIIKAIEKASNIEEYKVTEITEELPDGTTQTKTQKVKNENYEKELKEAIENINNMIKGIEGYDQTDEEGNVTHVEGELEKITQAQKDIVWDIDELYYYIEQLHKIYGKDYRITTLLTDTINYTNREEYLDFDKKIKESRESALAVLKEQVDVIANAYATNSLSELDKMLLSAEFGISFEKTKENEGKNPISEFFNPMFEDVPLSRIQCVELIKALRNFGIMSEAGNYCLIERITNHNNEICSCEDYLESRIQKLEYNGIPAEFEKELLNYLDATRSVAYEDIHVSNPKDAFIKYMKKTSVYTAENGDEIEIGLCNNRYFEVEGVDFSSSALTEDAIATKANTTTEDKEFQRIMAGINIDVLLESADSSDYIKVANTKYSGDNTLINQLMAIVNRYVNGADKVERYVTLENLKTLDISYNAYLKGIERLSELKDLNELNANYDYITNLEEVDWSQLKFLRKLGLAYNYIESIKPLEQIEFLEELDASNNLISGEFDFELAKLEYLKELNLANNKITDIRYVLEYVDARTPGKIGTYLARPDTLNLNLNNQELEMNITEDIFLNDNPSTIDVKLPQIFTQLLTIDTERTAFGETSQNGRIESEGKFVTLNTKTLGEKQGKVVVIAMSGDGTPVETCVGEGTTMTINYKVDLRVVNTVKIDPSFDVQVRPGNTQQFTAKVEGLNVNNTSVVWTIEGNTSENTKIDENGVLTVAEDEEAININVIATSVLDNTKSDKVEVNVNQKITDVVVQPSENVSIKPGEKQQFTVVVNGDHIYDASVVWTLEGNTDPATMVSENGLVLVAEGEQAQKLTLKVSPTNNPEISEVVEILVNRQNVTKLTVDPSENVSIKPGASKDFKATVEGTNLMDETVTWKVENATSAETTIDENGKLTVAEDEKANKIKVVAISNADNSVRTSVIVTIVKEVIKSVNITPENTTKAAAGSTVEFKATVTGENVKDTSVIWSVTGNESKDTVIDKNGKLTIAEDETAKTLVVKAASNADPSVVDQVNVDVTSSNVNKVSVYPAENVKVETGKEQKFTATVEGENVNDNSVTWSIEGNTSKDTMITKDGILTIGKDEKSDKVTVVATSNANNQVVSKVDIKVIKVASIGNIVVEPNKDVKINPGESQKFTVTVEGTNIVKQHISFKLQGATSSDTKIGTDGVLTVGENEVAKELKLIVNVVVNDTLEKTEEILIKVNQSEKPGVDINLGYQVEDEYLANVKARTSVNDFKANLVKDSNYKVVIRKDKQEVTTGNVGTGMYVQIQDKDGNVVADKNGNLYVFEVVVKGDVNGDGYANSLDSILIKAYRNEVFGVKLIGSFMAAADINNDNEITPVDSKLLLYHRAEVKGYNLDYVK